MAIFNLHHAMRGFACDGLDWDVTVPVPNQEGKLESLQSLDAALCLFVVASVPQHDVLYFFQT